MAVFVLNFRQCPARCNMARLPSRFIKTYINKLFVIVFITLHCGLVRGTERKHDIADYDPQIVSVEQKHIVAKEDYKKIVFELHGRNIQKGTLVRVTDLPSARNELCKADLKQTQNINYNVSELWTHEFVTGRYELYLPTRFNGLLYFCLPHGIQNTDDSTSWIPPNLIKSDLYHKWYHQGPNITLNTSTNETE